MTYSNNQKLMILLSGLAEMTPTRLDKLLSFYPNVSDIFRNADAPDFPIPALAESIKAQNKDTMQQQLDILEQNEISVIFNDHPCLNFRCAPPLLYVKGNLDVLNNGGVAIIGSRQCTRYGAEVAKSLGIAAAQSGITVISGGAQGIDSIALNAALENGGKAIAVLGFGMDKIYPAENKSLFAQIEKSGALVSEYPLGTPAYRSHFPMRNRIISGLCTMLAVVEASIKSGTSSTVTWAQEQGKEIVCVPGNITSEQSQGTNKLIKEGAKALTCADDMVEFFGKSLNKQPRKIVTLTPFEHKIADAFLVEEELSLDELAQKCNNSPGDVVAAVTFMELNGVLLRSQGSLYRLNKDNDYR